MSILSMIASIIVGIFLIYFGYLIAVKKMLSLIIGFNENTFYGDKNQYAKRSGLSAIILGILVLVMPLVVLVFGEAVIQSYKYIIGLYVVLMIIVANYWRFRF
ncbi:DUF3784 domain-containing protein [Bacillus sp. FJAT-50079]|uniref:DUF3784 domain-containing protein n=1 Tax=Bacillus sp. FJAT-50079 TaxID=2833577 RepID=UPI001BC9D4A6|nr:DUF3784 domain-containing protein [Bacillus sp. FJAT-50079]MBS4209900.1 DUF3784 domain-containing protein [Bacillus sp. FJAT-50079]